MVVLEVKHLKVWDEHTGLVIVRNTSFKLNRGKCLAIVGESGSGKSLTCQVIMRLTKKTFKQAGEIYLTHVPLHELSEQEMRKKRGKHIYMILQNGMTAFDPSCKIKVQLMEILKTHFDWNDQVMEQKLTQAMESINLRNAKKSLNCYPHQLSGGMLQRIMIALALVLEPDVIIADEPTTGLDTISQFEVINQLLKLRQTMKSAIIFVSHDLGIVRKIADEVIVMKGGEVVEKGSVERIFTNPSHDYTKFLMFTREALSIKFKEIMEKSYAAKS